MKFSSAISRDYPLEDDGTSETCFPYNNRACIGKRKNHLYLVLLNTIVSSSSMIQSLFHEIGPFKVILERRNYHL